MMDVKHRKSGFTLVELLTVLAITTMLVGLLVPSLNTVRRVAKETRQKAQLTTIGLALSAFRNDYGDYPPSDGWDYGTGRPLDYGGAQKLAEALLGWDLMGFHPQSAWRADGLDVSGGLGTYDPGKTRDNNSDGVPDTLDERIGRYIELATANTFRLGGPEGLFNDTDQLAPDTFVLCDVFGAKKIIIGGKTVKAGAPILYYRANTSGKEIHDIYHNLDNQDILVIKEQEDGRQHPLEDRLRGYEFFYGDPADPTVIGYIQDPKVKAIDWPYRPDSYILITAGADGLYGTGDDICNFGN